MIKPFKIFISLFSFITIFSITLDFAYYSRHIDIPSVSSNEVSSKEFYADDFKSTELFLENFKSNAKEFQNKKSGQNFSIGSWDIYLLEYQPILDLCACASKTNMKITQGNTTRFLNTRGGIIRFMIEDQNLYVETTDWIVYEISLPQIFNRNIFELWIKNRLSLN